jgi:hypothetical protein
MLKVFWVVISLLLAGCGSSDDSQPVVDQQSKLERLYIGGYVGYAPVYLALGGKVYQAFRVETTRQSEWLYSFEPISRTVFIADSCVIEYWAKGGKPVDSNAELIINATERYPCYVVW